MTNSQFKIIISFLLVIGIISGALLLMPQESQQTSKRLNTQQIVVKTTKAKKHPSITEVPKTNSTVLPSASDLDSIFNELDTGTKAVTLTEASKAKNKTTSKTDHESSSISDNLLDSNNESDDDIAKSETKPKT